MSVSNVAMSPSSSTTITRRRRSIPSVTATRYAAYSARADAEAQVRFRYPRDPRRPGARRPHRGGHGPNFPDVDLRASCGGEEQGLRVRADREPDADGA